MTTTPALHIRNLRFRYDPAGPWVVDVETLDLDRGGQLLLTGGSGRGKSTLLHLISGLTDPCEGAVEIDGVAVHALRGARRDLFRGEKVGMIFQNFNLLHGFSALENVMMAMMFSRIPRAEHKSRAADLLERLSIERPSARPDQLSIGQQQRVAVARALACDPVLVLADEPTASLDPENAGAAMDLIQSLCMEKQAALLCVSHDASMPARFETTRSFDDLAGATAP